MAEKKKVEKKEPEYATQQQFKSLEDSLSKIVDVVSTLSTNVSKLAERPATPEEVKKEAEIAKAAPQEEIVNPNWLSKAKEVLGEKLERCEVFYPKAGGTIFTLVISPKFSNAPHEYIERHKEDRRSKEIGNEGMEGVENWCKLVLANLNKPH
jgi:hypothetical protein